MGPEPGGAAVIVTPERLKTAATLARDLANSLSAKAKPGGDNLRTAGGGLEHWRAAEALKYAGDTSAHQAEALAATLNRCADALSLSAMTNASALLSGRSRP